MRLLPLLLLVLCACTAPEPIDDSADTDTDTDTDADTDVDTDTDTDIGAVVWDPADFEHVYEVGPGLPYVDPNEVPWESLAPSSLVRIHWRSEPYRTKWVIAVAATADDPVVVTGVPDAGRLPVITGEDATTRLALDYWNEERSVVKIGGSSFPGDVPSWVYVERLDIRSARPGYFFTDEGDNADEFNPNAAAIHVEEGNHLFLRGNDLHDSGNGLFVTSAATDVVVAGNHVYDNGIEGSIYEHNSYTEALRITFEYNHYGPLRDGCLGNNLKDRSGGLVVRYNWIEDGNRQLDLVETDSIAIRDDPAYRDTFVYGNVLVEGDGQGNSQIVHYGGDGTPANFRGGTLHLFHNTVISTRSGNTTLLRLSSDGETADVRNNVVVAGSLGISNEDGTVELRDNWLSQGWVDSHGGGSADDLGGNVSGVDPGYDADLVPQAGSALLDVAGPLHVDAAGHPVLREYVRHGQGRDRPSDGAPDIGAFEQP